MSRVRVRTEGRTDITKLIVTFRNFANTPKKWEGSVPGGEMKWGRRDAGNLELVGNSHESRKVEETFEGDEDCV